MPNDLLTRAELRWLLNNGHLSTDAELAKLSPPELGMVNDLRWEDRGRPTGLEEGLLAQRTAPQRISEGSIAPPSSRLHRLNRALVPLAFPQSLGAMSGLAIPAGIEAAITALKAYTSAGREAHRAGSTLRGLPLNMTKILARRARTGSRALPPVPRIPPSGEALEAFRTNIEHSLNKGLGQALGPSKDDIVAGLNQAKAEATRQGTTKARMSQRVEQQATTAEQRADLAHWRTQERLRVEAAKRATIERQLAEGGFIEHPPKFAKSMVATSPEGERLASYQTLGKADDAVMASRRSATAPVSHAWSPETATPVGVKIAREPPQLVLSPEQALVEQQALRAYRPSAAVQGMKAAARVPRGEQEAALRAQGLTQREIDRIMRAVFRLNP